MRKILLTLFVAVCGMTQLCAQVDDAFHGVLPVTDSSMKISLNGKWQLKVIKGITNDTTVPVTDSSWGTIPVPGCWEAYGFCQPQYNYPDSLTGYYRTSFVVPRQWKGQRIIIRFDGVLYGYDLWINDKKVGSWHSAYNTALFDITDYLNKKKDRQQLAMRVVSKHRGSDFDCNDDWAPNGIFRDVTLMAVPHTHLKDLTIHTRNSGEVNVETSIANPTKKTTVKHEILDRNGKVVGTDKVDHPHLWTAETPYLYTLRTTLLQKGQVLQTFEHRFGFREVTVEGNILKLNGSPVKLRGVTCHATDPKTVKVISEDLTKRDMQLMKEASVNYIRTSHYPREPRFYELADSLGFYVIDEVPFGFGDKNLSDNSFYPVLQQRAQATSRRDKNHASVIIWSIGNENPLTDICIRLGDYVKAQLDASRPVCYPQVGSYFRKFNYDFPKVADVYAPHYPTTSQIADFYQRADRPVIFTEYCHTLGISFEDHDRQWEIIERTPCIAGGSVWEWVDQGMPFKSEELRVKSEESADVKRYGYEERVFTTDSTGFEMCGNKGTDGLLYADRTPLPNYYELQHNYARAFVASIDTMAEAVRMKIHNCYDFVNLKDHVIFHWYLTNNRDTVLRGAFTPECPPRSQGFYEINLPRQKDLSLLQFDISDNHGHTFLHQSFVLNNPEKQWVGNGDPMCMIKEGPLVRVGRKETMAERLKVADKRIDKYLQPLDNPYVKTDVRIENDHDATVIDFTLTPDTRDAFLSELGIAFLLDQQIDRVQWIGQGPFASYPGRRQANRYGFWSKQMDDLYFEGNRMGVDAALFSSSSGKGLLLVGDSLNINFEQTDRGVVVSVNVAVSGQGPKFARTAFPVISRNTGTLHGRFKMYLVDVDAMTEKCRQFFVHPSKVAAPFTPFKTQYDTYLLRYSAH